MRKIKNFKIHDAALEYLRNSRFLDGKLDAASFSRLPLPADAPKRAEVVIYPGAFAKMVALLQTFATEVGWHGLCVRDPECGNRFIIEDIVVYPQVVTGTTINTDETRHGDWLDGFDDETFRKLRFHGHSHVNMPVFSSGTDDDLQRDLTNMLREDDFYLFFIMNKKLELFARLYDNKTGVIWETSDLDICISDGTVDLPAFVADAKSIVKETPAAKTHIAHQTKAPPQPPTAAGSLGGIGNAKFVTDEDLPYGYYDGNGKWISCGGSRR